MATSMKADILTGSFNFDWDMNGLVSIEPELYHFLLLRTDACMKGIYVMVLMATISMGEWPAPVVRIGI